MKNTTDSPLMEYDCKKVDSFFTSIRKTQLEKMSTHDLRILAVDILSGGKSDELVLKELIKRNYGK